MSDGFANLQRRGVKRTTSDLATPTSNAAATITYSADARAAHVIDSVEWSYDGTPTAGGLTIADGGSTVFSIAITAAGPGFYQFRPPLAGTAATAMTLTLAAGGSGVTGKLNAAHRLE